MSTKTLLIGAGIILVVYLLLRPKKDEYPYARNTGGFSNEPVPVGRNWQDVAAEGLNAAAKAVSDIFG